MKPYKTALIILAVFGATSIERTEDNYWQTIKQLQAANTRGK
jgi:hypothetical protein